MSVENEIHATVEVVWKTSSVKNYASENGRPLLQHKHQEC